MVCAPLAWNVLVKDMPINVMFQYLVTQAIELGLGCHKHYAVDRAMTIMEKLGFNGL